MSFPKRIQFDDSEERLVRDMRKRPWHWAPNAMFEPVEVDGKQTTYAAILGSSAVNVYYYLCRCADNDSQTCGPGKAAIMRACGTSSGTTTDAKKKLKAHRLIHVVERETRVGDRDTDMIFLLDAELWVPNPSLAADSDQVGQKLTHLNEQVEKPRSRGSKNGTGGSKFEVQVGQNLTQVGQELDVPYKKQDSIQDSNKTLQQHQETPSAPVDAVDVSKSSLKPSKKERKVASPFDGLTEAQIEIARLLVENGVWAKPAADLAASLGVTRQSVEHQIEWLPARVAEIEAKGGEVLNPAGLLRDAIFNMAPRPASLERASKSGAKARQKSAEEERQAEARRAANAKLDAEFTALDVAAQQALDAEIASVDSNRVHLPPANEREQRALVSWRRDYLSRGWVYTAPEAEPEAFDDDFNEEDYEEGPRYLWIDASVVQLNEGYGRLGGKEQGEVDAAMEAEIAKVVAAGHKAPEAGTNTWLTFRHKAMRKLMEAGTLRIVVPVDKECAA